MVAKVLIQSYLSDFHGSCIDWGLRQLGHDTLLWDPTIYPDSQELSVSVENGQPVKQTIRVADHEMTFEGVDTLWLRRQPQVKIKASLHEADQEFASTQCGEHIEGFLRSIKEQDVFQVNPRDNAVEINKKTPQLILAAKTGFTIPRSLFSNDQDAIRDFVSGTRSEVIFKPFKPNFWKSDTGTSVSYTAKLTPENMDGLASIKFSPGIFQEYIPKAYEVRVVFMGHTNIAFKLDSQNSVDENKVDWRVNQRALPISRIQLPTDVEKLCLQFMKKAGLVFGSFDFIVTKDGDFVFLEINEQGQFLGYEGETVPLLQPFLEFLASADPEFKWRETEGGLTALDFSKTPEFEAQQKLDLVQNEEHVAAFVSHE